MAARSLSGVLVAILLIPICLFLIVKLQAGFIFILFGLLPSLVAYFVDFAKGKPTFKCVLSCNVAGMLPTLMDVMRSSSMPSTMQTAMGDPLVWITVYAAAAGGYGLLMTCRTLAQIGIIISWDARIESLLKKQEKLVEEWGPEVKVRQT